MFIIPLPFKWAVQPSKPYVLLSFPAPPPPPKKTHCIYERECLCLKSWRYAIYESDILTQSCNSIQSALKEPSSARRRIRYLLLTFLCASCVNTKSTICKKAALLHYMMWKMRSIFRTVRDTVSHLHFLFEINIQFFFTYIYIYIHIYIYICEGKFLLSLLLQLLFRIVLNCIVGLSIMFSFL